MKLTVLCFPQEKQSAVLKLLTANGAPSQDSSNGDVILVAGNRQQAFLLTCNPGISDPSVAMPVQPTVPGAPELQGQHTCCVTGATGGVGKRVVQTLLQKGKAVRALVRNENKARSLLVSHSFGSRI